MSCENEIHFTFPSGYTTTLRYVKRLSVDKIKNKFLVDNENKKTFIMSFIKDPVDSSIRLIEAPKKRNNKIIQLLVIPVVTYTVTEREIKIH